MPTVRATFPGWPGRETATITNDDPEALRADLDELDRQYGEWKQGQATQARAKENLKALPTNEPYANEEDKPSLTSMALHAPIGGLKRLPGVALGMLGAVQQIPAGIGSMIGRTIGGETFEGDPLGDKPNPMQGTGQSDQELALQQPVTRGLDPRKSPFVASHSQAEQPVASRTQPLFAGKGYGEVPATGAPLSINPLDLTEEARFWNEFRRGPQNQEEYKAWLASRPLAERISPIEANPDGILPYRLNLDAFRNATDALESLPEMGGIALATAYGGPAAGLGLGAALGAGHAGDANLNLQDKQRMVADPEQQAAAVGAGVLSGLSESLPIGRMLGGASKVASPMRRVGTGFGEEAIQETGSKILEDAASADPEQQINFADPETYLGQLLETGLKAGLLGGGFAGAVDAAPAMMRERKAGKALKELQGIAHTPTPADIIEGADGAQGMQPVDMQVPPPTEAGQPAPDPAQQAQTQLAELNDNWEAMMRGESTATFFPAGAPAPTQIPDGYGIISKAPGLLVYHKDSWQKGIALHEYNRGPEGIAALTKRSRPKAAAPAPAQTPAPAQAQAAPPPPLIQPQAAAAPQVPEVAPTSGTTVPAAGTAQATESVEDLKRHQATLEEQRDKLKKLIGPRSDPRLATTLKNVETALGANEKKLKDALRKVVVEKHLAKAQQQAPQQAAPPVAPANAQSDPEFAAARDLVVAEKQNVSVTFLQRKLNITRARATEIHRALYNPSPQELDQQRTAQAPQAMAPADIIEGVDGTQGIQPVDMQVPPAQAQPPLVKPARAPKDARQDKRLFDVRQRAAGKVLPPEGPPPPPEAPRPTKPLASRAQAGATQTRTASVEDTERVLEIARRAFPGFNFKSIDDISQASPETQAEAAKGAPGKAWIEGNTATVLRTANESAQDVATQILHEFGHTTVELAVANSKKGDAFRKSLMRSEWGRKAMQKWVDEWHESYEIDKSLPLEKQDEETLDLIADETIAKLIERKLSDPDFKTPPWYAGVRATARHRLASWRDAFSTTNGKPLADWYVNSLSEKDIDGLLLKGLRQARRGASVGSAGDDDVDFSRAKRRQKDLLATHGISGERLLSILKDHDGLFPAPSIAITRGAEIPSAYGGWKIIFPPDTINPDREFKGSTGKITKPNKVYGADAYSPMVESADMPGTREHRELLAELEKAIDTSGKLNGKAVFAIGAIVKKGGTAHFTSNHNLRIAPTPHGLRYTVETREHKPDEFGDPQPDEVLNGFTYTYPSDGFVDIANRITSEIRTTLVDDKGARNTIDSVIKKKASQGMSLARKKPDEYDDGGIQGAKLISQQPLRTMQQVIEYSKKALPGASTAEDAFRGDKTNEAKIQLARDGAWIRRKADAYGGGINGVKRVVAALRGAMSDFDSRNDEDEWYDLTEGRSKSVAFAMQHPMYPDPLHVAAHSEADGVHVRIYDSHGSIGSAVLPVKAGSKALKIAVTSAAARGVDPAYYVKAWEFIRDYPTTLLEATPVRAVDIREAKAVVVTKQAAARQPELVEMLKAFGIPVEIVGSGTNIGAPRTSEIDRVARERKLYFSRGKDKLPSGDPGDPGWAPARPSAESESTGEPTDSMASTDPDRYTNWEAKQRAAGQTEEPETDERGGGPGRMWDPSWEDPGQRLRDAEVAAELARGTDRSSLGPLKRTGREFEKSEYQKEIERRTKLREDEPGLSPMRQINPNTYAPSRPDGDPSPRQVSPATPERVSDREVAAANRWTPEQLEKAKAAKESGRLTERERRPRMPLDPTEEAANDTKRTTPVRMLDANKEIYNALKGNVVGSAVGRAAESEAVRLRWKNEPSTTRDKEQLGGELRTGVNTGMLADGRSFNVQIGYDENSRAWVQIHEYAKDGDRPPVKLESQPFNIAGMSNVDVPGKVHELVLRAIRGTIKTDSVQADETDIATTKQAIDPEFEPREARAGFPMVDYDMVSDEIAREIQQLIDSHQPGAEVRGVKPGQTGVIPLPHGGKATVGVAGREPLKADVKFYNDTRGPLRASLDTIVRSVANGSAEAFANLTFSVDGTTFYRAEIRPADYGNNISAEDSFRMVVIDFLSENGKTLYGTAEFDAESGIIRDDILGHAAYHIKEAGAKMPGGPALTITGRGGIEATASLDEALVAEEAERQKEEEERAKEKGKKPNPWAWDIDPREHAEILISAAAQKFHDAAMADAPVEKKTKWVPAYASEGKERDYSTIGAGLASLRHYPKANHTFRLNEDGGDGWLRATINPRGKDEPLDGTHIVELEHSADQSGDAPIRTVARFGIHSSEWSGDFDTSRPKSLSEIGEEFADLLGEKISAEAEPDSDLEALPTLEWAIGMGPQDFTDIGNRFLAPGGGHATLGTPDPKSPNDFDRTFNLWAIVTGSDATVELRSVSGGADAGLIGERKFKINPGTRPSVLADLVLGEAQQILHKTNSKPVREVLPPGMSATALGDKALAALKSDELYEAWTDARGKVIELQWSRRYGTAHVSYGLNPGVAIFEANEMTPSNLGHAIAEAAWHSKNDPWRLRDEKDGVYLAAVDVTSTVRSMTASLPTTAVRFFETNDSLLAGSGNQARVDLELTSDQQLLVEVRKKGQVPFGEPSTYGSIFVDVAEEIDDDGRSYGRRVIEAVNEVMRRAGLAPSDEPTKPKKKDPNRIVRFSRGRVPSQSEIDAEREAGSKQANTDRAGVTTEKSESLREEKEFPIDSIRQREMTRQKVKDWYAEADERLNTPQKLAAETKRLLEIAKDHYASAYNERGRRTLQLKLKALEPADIKLMQRVADFMEKAWEDSGRDPEIGADLNLLITASQDLGTEQSRAFNARKNLSKTPAAMAKTMLRELLLGNGEQQIAPVAAAAKMTGLESQDSLLKQKIVRNALDEISKIAAQVTELREALKTPMPEMKPLQPAGKGPGKGPGAGKASDPAQLSPAQAGQVLTGPGGKKITRRQAQTELNSLEDRLVRLLKLTKGVPPGKLSPEQRGALAVAELARIKKDHGIDLASWTDADWEDTPQVLSLMRELTAEKATRMDRAYEWWLNAILSGVSTQAVNATSNLMFNIYEEGIRALRTGLKAASGSDAHDADADYLLSVWGGMARSIPRAWANAVWAWSNEASKFGHDATKWDERKIRTAIGGKPGRIVRGFGTRQLLAADEFFKSIIGEGEAAGNAYGIAKDEAAKKKLTPKSAEYNRFLEKRMRELIEDLTSPAWTEAVTTEVNRRTFQADLHDVWQLVARARNMTPGARWIAPFITTPVNVLIEGMRAVPLIDPALEFTKATVKNHSAKAGLAAISNADTLARQSMSLAFLMFLVAGDEPDEKGMSMVEGPSEAGRNRALREWEVGRSKPQTIALPGTDRRLDYSRVEPAATAIGMTASLAKNIRDAIAGRKQPSVAAASVMSAFWRQMQDKTMLKGLTDAKRAFVPEEGDSTWGARMGQWGMRFAGSFVPKAATQFWVRPDDEIREGDLWGAKKTGDVDREAPLTKAMRNSWASLKPSADNPRVDPWGVNVQRDSVSAGAADPFLTPFGIVRGSALSVREPGRGKPEMIKEIDELFAKYNAKHPDAPLAPARPQKSIELRNKQGIKYKAYLTDDEYEEYSRLHGETRQEVFKSAMAMLRKNVDILPDVLEAANKAANEKAKKIWTGRLMTEK